MTRRAWQDIRTEMDARLERISERLEQADPQRTPDAHYWLHATRELDVRRWDDATIGHLCDEVRGIYQRSLWVKANVKFLALHVGDLRWLADYGANAAEAVIAVPTNRALKQTLTRAEEFKVMLNDELGRVRHSPIGQRVKELLKPNADISGAGRAGPGPTRQG